MLLEGIPPLPPSIGSRNVTSLDEVIADGGDRVVRTPLVIEDWNVLEVTTGCIKTFLFLFMWYCKQTRYLLPQRNETHLYLFAGSVRYLHPEFDAALSTLLRTDMKAVVVIAAAGAGRDKLPATHRASRYDLMHPSMPAAAVARVKERLRMAMGVEASR